MIGSMWVGDRTLAELVRAGDVSVEGLPRLADHLADWIGTSVFGDIEPASTHRRG